MVDGSIFDTSVFKLVEKELLEAMKKVQLICDICWKFGWRKNTINLNQPGYDKKIQIVSNEKENASLTMY